MMLSAALAARTPEGDGNAGGNWGQRLRLTLTTLRIGQTHRRPHEGNANADVDADADADAYADTDATSCTHNFPKILSCPTIYNFSSYFAKFEAEKNVMHVCSVI